MKTGCARRKHSRFARLGAGNARAGEVGQRLLSFVDLEFVLLHEALPGRLARTTRKPLDVVMRLAVFMAGQSFRR